uniref:VWFA domain-containing protein n=1 Tax=Onchocerca volvulus TaxID=6282 RepID=A0A8R1XS99_ONCVO
MSFWTKKEFSGSKKPSSSMANVHLFLSAFLFSSCIANPADFRLPINNHEQFKAEGIRLVDSYGEAPRLEKDLRNGLIRNRPSEAVEKPQIKESTDGKISPQDGNFDLLFTIDLSPRQSADLKNQLKLLMELINRLPDEDINEQRIRIAIITFGQEAQLNLEWGKATTKAEILQHLKSIRYVAGNSSALAGIRFAYEYAQKSRRSNARLIIILASDGNSQDIWHSIMQTARKLHKLQEAAIYAMTTSKQYRFIQLEAFTGDKWKVYVDGRIRQFVSDMREQYLSFSIKVLGIKEDDEKEELFDVSSSPIIKSIQAHNDLVDFAILVDKSTKADDKFEVMKKFLKELIRTLQFIDKEKRVKISLVSFDDNAHIEIDLRKSTAKEDVLYAVERLQNEYKKGSSVSAAVNAALSQISVSDKSRRRIFLILTDGSSRDSVKTMTTTAVKLQQINAEVYIAPITNKYSKDELLLYVGKQGTLITSIKDYKKKLTSYVKLSGDESVKKDFVEETKVSTGKITAKTSDQSHLTSKSDVIVESKSDATVKSKSDATVKSKSDATVERKSDVAVERKSDVAVERKSDATVKSKSDVAVESKLDAIVKSKSDATVKSKSDVTVERKSDVAVERKSDVAVESKSDVTIKSTVENKAHHDDFSLSSAEIKSKHIIYLQGQTGDPNCLVDLVFILDKSQSVQKTFQKQLDFAATLIKAISPADFDRRIRVAAVTFSSHAEINFGFDNFNNQNEILNALLSLAHLGGNTSSVSGVNLAIKEIRERGRIGARKMVVLISDGKSQDYWENLLDASDRLHATDAIVYAITANDDYYFRELELYTRNKWRVYVDTHNTRFLDDAILSLLKCQEPSVPEFSFSPPTVSPTIEDKKVLPKEDELVKRDSPLVSTRQVRMRMLYLYRCKYSKMDLQIILDASTSRRDVFEHQRELALSLIERLPISTDETHVAVGINSFTSVPTLRQTLGLGRDKQMVRHAIEDIKYIGGSTYTAQAVELSVQDLKRGRRPDAIQVVVLMNDGMSQDRWERVLEASQLLRATGAELFGVALGDNIDLRELKQYIGSADRIYRDNSTERFLTDVVSLLTGGKDCSLPSSVRLKDTETPSRNLNDQLCSNPNLDIIILFDNAIKTNNLSEQSISSNRYLLLDVLGSLPVANPSGQVKISVIAFNSQPQVIISMSNVQDIRARDDIFAKVESIKAKASVPSYAKAVDFAVGEYNKEHRKDARGILVIVGNGQSQDNLKERNEAIEHLCAAAGLSRYAVDSGKWVDVDTLSRYTGSPDNVFNYDRNAEFAKLILNAAAAANKTRCVRMSSEIFAAAMSGSKSAHNKQNEKRENDISNKLDLILERLGNEKIVSKGETTTVVDARISQPAVKSVNVREIAKEDSVLATSSAKKKDQTLLVSKNEQLEESAKSSSSNFELNASQMISSSSSHRERKIIKGDSVLATSTADQTLLDEKNSKNGELEESAKSSSRSELSASQSRSELGASQSRSELGASQSRSELGASQSGSELDASQGISNSIFHRGQKKKDSDLATSTAKRKDQTLLNEKNSKKEQLEESAKSSSGSELGASQEISSSSLHRGQKIAKEDSDLATSAAKKRNQALLDGRSSKNKQLGESAKSSSSSEPSATRTKPNSGFHRQSINTTFAPDTIVTFSPGCEIDVMILIDASGSVEETFDREKEFAAEIINQLPISPKNAHVALIKFAAKEKVRTVWSFNRPQEQQKVLEALLNIPFTSGTTAIHTALLQAVKEYSSAKGARPTIATPIVIIFTDGFGQKDTTEAATLLRDVIPNIFAVAVGEQHPVNHAELVKITGSNNRVFMDSDIEKLYEMLRKITRTC